MDWGRTLHRANVEMAESSGILDYEKMFAGVPLDWKLVSGIEVDAILENNLPYTRRMIQVEGPIGTGWAPAYIYDAILLWEKMGESYADMTLSEWLKKTLI